MYENLQNDLIITSLTSIKSLLPLTIYCLGQSSTLTQFVYNLFNNLDEVLLWNGSLKITDSSGIGDINPSLGAPVLDLLKNHSPH